jgi:hypothetical protein
MKKRSSQPRSGKPVQSPTELHPALSMKSWPQSDDLASQVRKYLFKVMLESLIHEKHFTASELWATSTKWLR